MKSDVLLDTEADKELHGFAKLGPLRGADLMDGILGGESEPDVFRLPLRFDHAPSSDLCLQAKSILVRFQKKRERLEVHGG